MRAESCWNKSQPNQGCIATGSFISQSTDQNRCEVLKSIYSVHPKLAVLVNLFMSASLVNAVTYCIIYIKLLMTLPSPFIFSFFSSSIILTFHPCSFTQSLLYNSCAEVKWDKSFSSFQTFMTRKIRGWFMLNIHCQGMGNLIIWPIK